MGVFDHVDPGRIISRVIRDPKNQEDPVIRTQRERVENGILVESDLNVDPENFINEFV